VSLANKVSWDYRGVRVRMVKEELKATLVTAVLQGLKEKKAV
jgi:hypothetical protein